MPYEIKVAVVWLAHCLTWPFSIPAILDYRLLGSERLFDFGAKLLSLVPGRPGQYVRTSYYVQTLKRCSYDFSMGFASFFSHNTAEVGRGVKIGTFSIIGTSVLGDHVVIGSRVSVLSGKYHHGGGSRGRDFKNNSVYYEQVRIGEGSWLGEGSIVMCDVGRHAIVSAGSVVTKPIPDGVTAVGNPARYLRYEQAADEPMSAKRKLLASGMLVLATAVGTGVPGQTSAAEQRIVLVGASIGRAWNIANLPARMRLDGVHLEYVGVPDTFDKSAAVAALVDRPARPDVVIIKECSTYFPGPWVAYRDQVRGWVETLRRAGIRPVLATAVPIAPPDDLWSRTKAWVRGNLLGGDAKMAQLLAYNDWVRTYAAAHRLPVLDLEGALRESETERWLRPQFAAPDRVHLNAAGYRVLDAHMARFVAGLPHRVVVDGAMRQRVSRQ